MTEVISNYGLLILVLVIAVPLAYVIKRSQKSKTKRKGAPRAKAARRKGR
jgi:hypothetical protein